MSRPQRPQGKYRWVLVLPRLGHRWERVREKGAPFGRRRIKKPCQGHPDELRSSSVGYTRAGAKGERPLAVHTHARAAIKASCSAGRRRHAPRSVASRIPPGRKSWACRPGRARMG